MLFRGVDTAIIDCIGCFESWRSVILTPTRSPGLDYERDSNALKLRVEMVEPYQDYFTLRGRRGLAFQDPPPKIRVITDNSTKLSFFVRKDFLGYTYLCLIGPSPPVMPFRFQLFVEEPELDIEWGGMANIWFLHDSAHKNCPLTKVEWWKARLVSMGSWLGKIDIVPVAGGKENADNPLVSYKSSYPYKRELFNSSFGVILSAYHKYSGPYLEPLESNNLTINRRDVTHFCALVSKDSLQLKINSLVRPTPYTLTQGDEITLKGKFALNALYEDDSLNVQLKGNAYSIKKNGVELIPRAIETWRDALLGGAAIAVGLFALLGFIGKIFFEWSSKAHPSKPSRRYRPWWMRR